MKQQIRILTLITITFASTAALAEAPVSKSALHVDFNKMIEDNNNQRTTLHQDIDERAAQQKTPAQAAHKTAKPNDKDKVVDFIDVEVGVGQAPSLVDRRYDSVGEAQIAGPEVLIKN